MLPADPTSGGLVVLEPGEGARALADVDVVFPVLHGAYGEDGTIQGLLEMAGMPVRRRRTCSPRPPPWTRSSPRSSPPPRASRSARTWCCGPGSRCRRPTSARLGLPVFVKPSRAGSSFGITKVNDWADLDAAIAIARADRPEGAGRGRHRRPRDRVRRARGRGRRRARGVAAGRGPRRARPRVLRLRGQVRRTTRASSTIPAELPAHVARQVQEYACRTFTALDCAGLARVDFFVTPDLEVYLNEINTMPGFTPTSMFPRMWAASGLEYPKLVSRLIRTALRRGTGLH